MLQRLRTIDAHVGGQPVRVLIDGVPHLSGRTLAQKRAGFQRRADDIRKALVLEPRGHVDMCAALLTEPVTPGAHAGLLFMLSEGFVPLSGAAVIAVATIALERGLISGAGESLTFDTEAGSVYAAPHLQSRGSNQRVDSVTLTCLPSTVHRAGHVVRVGTRQTRVDIASSGLVYAIVDAEAVGLSVDRSRLPELRRSGIDVLRAVNESADRYSDVPHVDGAIFTGPPHDPEAHLRSVTVSAAGAVDRSPCATGTAAVMAVLDAMQLLPEHETFVHEGLLGLLHRGRIVRRTDVSGAAAIVPAVQGSAWITGDHTFYVDDDDPLRLGVSA